MNVLGLVAIIAYVVWILTMIPGIPAQARYANIVALAVLLGCLVLDALGLADASA